MKLMTDGSRIARLAEFARIKTYSSGPITPKAGTLVGGQSILGRVNPERREPGASFQPLPAREGTIVTRASINGQKALFAVD